MPRKKPFSVKQKKKQLQDKRERKRGKCGSGRRGRGSSSGASGRRGVPAAPLGGTGGEVAARLCARATAEGILSPLHPYVKGVGRMGSWGKGIPPAPTAPSPQIPGGGLTTPVLTQEGPEQGGWQDRAPEEVGWR